MAPLPTHVPGVGNLPIEEARAWSLEQLALAEAVLAERREEADRANEALRAVEKSHQKVHADLSQAEEQVDYWRRDLAFRIGLQFPSDRAMAAEESAPGPGPKQAEREPLDIPFLAPEPVPAPTSIEQIDLSGWPPESAERLQYLLDNGVSFASITKLMERGIPLNDIEPAPKDEDLLP